MMVKKVDSSNFDDLVLSSHKPTVVKFYSRDCYLCRGLSPVFDTLASKYAHKLDFYKVDVDEDSELSEPYLDGGVPTIQIFYRDIPPVLIEYPQEDKIHPVTGYAHDYLDQWLYFYLVSFSVLEKRFNNE